MVEWLKQLAYELSLRFKSRARLEAENLVLRQQLNILIRKLPKRMRLANSDRLLLVWLYRLFPSILSAVRIVRPETAIRWHRRGFRAYWRWKSRPGAGRPAIDGQIRDLIQQMSVPALFQAVCHQAVFWPDQHELTLRQLNLLAGALDLDAMKAMDLGSARPQLLENLERYLQRIATDSLQDQTTDDFIHTTSRNDLAGQLSRFDAAALAYVDWGRLPLAEVIAHGHTVSAFATQDQALQQGRSITCRAAPPIISVASRFRAQCFLIRLVLLPADVAGERVG